ncbi:hypothetical protein PR048_003082 [Dryococelus australis]|uniref:Uncharacterized protein n=1 Tax=Dryococelus australis TaxID=614101 RepID=A0ABQ9IM23_9NEOP|nr:hypothetical protein PR048_003082 [Dryococelus australis]
MKSALLRHRYVVTRPTSIMDDVRRSTDGEEMECRAGNPEIGFLSLWWETAEHVGEGSPIRSHILAGGHSPPDHQIMWQPPVDLHHRLSPSSFIPYPNYLSPSLQLFALISYWSAVESWAGLWRRKKRGGTRKYRFAGRQRGDLPASDPQLFEKSSGVGSAYLQRAGAGRRRMTSDVTPMKLVPQSRDSGRENPICTVQDHDGNTVLLARRSDKTLGVRVRVARIAPSFLDLGPNPWESWESSGCLPAGRLLDRSLSPGPDRRPNLNLRRQTAHAATAYLVLEAETNLNLKRRDSKEPEYQRVRFGKIINFSFEQNSLHTTTLLVGWFSLGSLVSSTLAFRRCSILTSLRFIGSQDNGWNGEIWIAIKIEVLKADEGEARWGIRETPEKTRRPAASSGAISTCENPGTAPPGIEPGSPRLGDSKQIYARARAHTHTHTHARARAPEYEWPQIQFSPKELRSCLRGGEGTCRSKGEDQTQGSGRVDEDTVERLQLTPTGGILGEVELAKMCTVSSLPVCAAVDFFKTTIIRNSNRTNPLQTSQIYWYREQTRKFDESMYLACQRGNLPDYGINIQRFLMSTEWWPQYTCPRHSPRLITMGYPFPTRNAYAPRAHDTSRTLRSPKLAFGGGHIVPLGSRMRCKRIAGRGRSLSTCFRALGTRVRRSPCVREFCSRGNPSRISDISAPPHDSPLTHRRKLQILAEDERYGEHHSESKQPLDRTTCPVSVRLSRCKGRMAELEMRARPQPRRSGFVPRPGHTGFSHVGIMPDDTAGWRVFSGISRFPPPFHSGAAPYSPQSPASALKTLILRAVQISSLTHSLVKWVF